MKILYLGHFLEDSSWSKVAIENLKALSLYCEINWRPIIINSKKFPEEIRKYHKQISKSNICIQHVLPSFMQKGNIPCVGFFEQETDTIKHTGWQERLNIMDQVWVPNKKHLQNNYKLVRHPTDLEKYKKTYPKLNLPKDTYIFYTIAEFNRRKRLPAIIRAFHLSFNKNDQALLVIKVNKGDTDSESLRQEIFKINELIKQELHLKKYIDPIIISERLTDEQIYGLHQSCDCYINASFGEAHCIPILDALGFNRNVITSDVVDYVKTNVIPGQKEPCIGAEQYVPNLHSARENWENVSILDLSKQMRKIYDEKLPALVHDLSEFSYEKVGENMFNNLKELI